MYIHVNGILKKCLRTIIILVVPMMNIYRDLLWFNKTKHQMRNIVLIQFVLCLYYEKLYNRVTSLFEWPLCWPFPTLTMHQSLTQLCDKNKILEYLLKMSCFHHPIQNGTWMYRWPAWGEPHFLGPFWEPGLPCSLNTFHWLMWKVLIVIQCVIKQIVSICTWKRMFNTINIIRFSET